MTKNVYFFPYNNDGENKMRTFYIFKIKNEYAALTKNNPYHLFKMLSYIYNLETNELDRGVELFNKITNSFNTKEIDIALFKAYRENYFYTKFKNVHQMNNIYKREETTLVIRKKFLLLKSSIIRPTFLNNLTKYDNLFFCDFKNKDYFWLEKLFI